MFHVIFFDVFGSLLLTKLITRILLASTQDRSFASREMTVAIADLSRVLKIFGESSPSEEKQKALYREVLLMTLARASSSDANIHPVEIETIQQIFARRHGWSGTNQ